MTAVGRAFFLERGRRELHQVPHPSAISRSNGSTSSLTLSGHKARAPQSSRRWIRWSLVRSYGAGISLWPLGARVEAHALLARSLEPIAAVAFLEEARRAQSRMLRTHFEE